MVWKMIARRLLGMIPLLWVVTTVSFFFIRLAPGGPFDREQNLPAEIQAQILAKYHLDEPLWDQYVRYMKMLLQGDLGPSYRHPSRTVNEIIWDTFPESAIIGLLGLLYAAVVGIGIGLWAGSRPHSLRDYLGMGWSMLGVCLPSFVIGPVLMWIFAIKLQWLPVSGWGTWQNLVLPSLTLGTMYAAFFARLTRGSVMEVMHQDFIRTARAKGVDEQDILWKHALKSALLPAVSLLGPASAAMLTGSLVVETVFEIPGMGRFFVQSAVNRDYTLVMGCVLFVAVIITLMNLLVDIIHLWLDPRVATDTGMGS